MAIQVYSLGTAAERRTAGQPAVSYNFSVPANFPVGTIIRFKARRSGYSLSATDSAGNAYSLGGDNFGPTGTYSPLNSGDTITITFTPTAGGAGYFMVAGYAVTGSDFQIFNGATSSSTSGTTATDTWGPIDYAANLAAAGKTARAAAYVTELIYFAGYDYFPTPSGLPGATISITGEPAHSNLNNVSVHPNASSIYADGLEGLWQSYRIYTTGRGDGESGTVTGSSATSTFPNPNIGNLNGIAYFADTSLPPLSGPWAHHPPFRGFRGLYAKDGDIKGRSAHTPGPLSLGSEFSITGGTTDSEPAVADGQLAGIADRLVLLFTRGSDVYRSISDGDGEAGTWSTPTLMFSGCKHPDINYDRTSRTFFYLARETATGNLKGSIQGPGDASPIAAFTLTNESGVALVVDDDTARVSPAEDGPRRWRMAVMISGAYTVWKCTDDGSSWKQEI